MIDPADSSQLFPCSGCSIKSARNLVRTVNDGEFSLTPEKTEEEKRLETSTFSYSKQLTPEEEKRVLYLKNMLAQILSLADGQPSEEQKSRIKEIEKELEKITGVKMRSSISDTTSKMPGKKEDDEEQEQHKNLRGIDPKEAIHSNIIALKDIEHPGIMQFIQRNAMTAYLKKDLSSEALGSLKSIKA